jgi:hypothetical protein
MTPEQFLERLVHETYAAHCMLMMLGFEPAEVFVGAPDVANMTPPGPCAVVTVARGDSRCVLPIQPLTGEEQCSRYLDAWQAFAVTGKRSLSRDQLDRIVSSSTMYARRFEFVTALVVKGFKLTGALN